MRLLLTATSFFPAVGGAQLHWHKVGSLLVSRGHRVQVVTQWTENRTDWLLGTTIFAPQQERRFQAGGVNIFSLSPRLSARLAAAPFVASYHIVPEIASLALAQLFSRDLAAFARGADLVHNVRIGRDYFSWASYQAAQESKIPFFITPNFSPRMMTAHGRFMVRTLLRLLRRADGVFAFTEEERDVLTQLGVDPRKIEVIGVGPLTDGTPNPTAFARRFSIQGPMVLFLGQKYEYKGYRQLLAAAPLIWRYHPETHFAFIGPHVGCSKRVFDRARSDRRILDLDPDSSALKASALSLCTVLCLPSRQEGFGGVYTEAWYYGKPVIGCDIPFVRSVIQNGEDGLLVSQDPQEIADAILYLLDHPEARQKMAEAGRHKVIAKYNWEAITTRVEDFYVRRLRPCESTRPPNIVPA